MSEKTITLAEAPQWVEKAMARKKNALLLAMTAAARRTVVHLQTEVIPATTPVPVDRGLYRAGWRVHTHARGVTIFNVTPGNYGTHIERGVRAANVKVGKKMIDALEAWAKRKGLTPRGGAAGKRDRGGRFIKGSKDAGYRGIAWAIAMKMKKRGIFNGGKGLRILERAALAFPDFLREEIRHVMRK